LILLADTHLLLWTALKPHLLSQKARDLIEADVNEPAFSVVSLWEISIKRAQGREDLQVDPRRLRRRLIENAWREIPIDGEHAIIAGGLPPIHKDPFDRLLVAQAMVEGARLLTVDSQLARYGAPVVRV
jgi:PIN domain nuclease of toxin-antitoxin system